MTPMHIGSAPSGVFGHKGRNGGGFLVYWRLSVGAVEPWGLPDKDIAWIPRPFSDDKMGRNGDVYMRKLKEPKIFKIWISYKEFRMTRFLVSEYWRAGVLEWRNLSRWECALHYYNTPSFQHSNHAKAWPSSAELWGIVFQNQRVRI